MSKRWILSIARAAVAAALVVPAAAAQTSTELRNATVVAAWGNFLVVKLADGTTEEFEVPPDFRLDLDGKQVAVADLKPGIELSATVKTTKKPIIVRTTEIRNGEVVRTGGGALFYRDETGVHKWDVPKGFMFLVDGNPARLNDLKKGTKLTATIVRPVATTVTTVEVGGVAATDPAAKAAAAAAAAKAAADKAAAEAAQAKAAADKAALEKAAAEAEAAKASAEKAAAEAAEAKAAAEKAQAEAKMASGAKSKAEAEAAAARAVADQAAAERAEKRTEKAGKQASASAPVKVLPKTGSALPLVAVFGVLCIAIGGALNLLRKI